METLADYFAQNMREKGISWLERWEESVRDGMPEALAELKLSGDYEEVTERVSSVLFYLHRAGMFAGDAVAPASDLVPHDPYEDNIDHGVAARLRREAASDCADSLDAVTNHLKLLFMQTGMTPGEADGAATRLVLKRIDYLIEDYRYTPHGNVLVYGLEQMKKDYAL